MSPAMQQNTKNKGALADFWPLHSAFHRSLSLINLLKVYWRT